MKNPNLKKAGMVSDKTDFFLRRNIDIKLKATS